MKTKIVCNIEPGLMKQTVFYYKGEQLISSERIEMNNLVNYLLGVCYSDNIYNLHLLGNWSYLSGIIEQIQTEEVTKYSENRIIIEVN